MGLHKKLEKNHICFWEYLKWMNHICFYFRSSMIETICNENEHISVDIFFCFFSIECFPNKMCILFNLSSKQSQPQPISLINVIKKKVCGFIARKVEKGEIIKRSEVQTRKTCRIGCVIAINWIDVVNLEWTVKEKTKIRDKENEQTDRHKRGWEKQKQNHLRHHISYKV